MKRILFLQNNIDAIGGVTYVNVALANEFLKRGEEVFIDSLRFGGFGQTVEYPSKAVVEIINEKEKWDCPRLSDAISLLQKGKWIQAIRFIQKRKKYDRSFKADLKKLQEHIKSIHPDIIINSHYELLPGIPQEYQKKTVNHYHTNFEQVLQSKSQRKMFWNYRDKIGKFVWLTKQTMEQAKKMGIQNSTYLYNPIRFHATQKSNVRENKQVIFIGRYSEEKRLELAIRLFEQVVKEDSLQDWKFAIYSIGELPQEILEKGKSPHILLQGSTDHPEQVLQQASLLLLTSSYEGFPLVVLEANECGVPALAFDFGESSKEVITKKTGIVVKQNDEQSYQEKLTLLMKNADLRQELSQNAIAFANQFSIEKIVDKWYCLFEELLLQ